MFFKKGSSLERKPFIEENDQYEFSNPAEAQPESVPFFRSFLWAACFHLTIIAGYTIMAIIILAKALPPAPTSLHPIPNLKFQYVAKAYTDFEISPFSGPPSPSVDGAWHELLEKTTLRVSKSELERSNQSSVEFPEGGGFMAWLGVYHELHCLKMLRQWNYREHYHPNITEKDRPHWDIHADHCIDVLRSAAMCHADTTLTTFGWLDQPKPMLNTRPIEHKCVDWNILMASVEDRVVSREEMAALTNPKQIG
ncbi:hypothetical protein HYFRA_00006119 [Hymenoscyphus fraxineus]|uniref:Uncharacterized protein n=1 Tax=Hymenoscyphus fraxineus TaxID=746836 RepID=A0A9N9L711_9HELO|nr:hypothetical protein HYFRA_00006119 [Hymenoscyphus fraxineus]